MQPLPVVPSSYSTWGLDPLFMTHVKLPLSALSRMTHPPLPPAVAAAGLSGVRLYAFGPSLAPRPLQLVHVAGFVVSVVTYRKSVRFVLDDGSGVGHCVWYHEGREGAWGRLRLGVYLSIMGKMCATGRGGAGGGGSGAGEVVEVVVQLADFAREPDAEMLWWVEVKRAHEECYWVRRKEDDAWIRGGGALAEGGRNGSKGLTASAAAASAAAASSPAAASASAAMTAAPAAPVVPADSAAALIPDSSNTDSASVGKPSIPIVWKV